MAACKYLVILTISLCYAQLIAGGNLKRLDSFDVPENENLPEVAEDVEVDEATLKKKAKETFSTYMANPVVQGTVDSFRQTAELILTDPISSDALIKLMHIIRKAMTHPQSLITVRSVQRKIKKFLNQPMEVQTFFDGLTHWFKDPQSLENVKRKDELVQRCIHLTAQTDCIDNITKAVKQMNYSNMPEAIEAVFKNFQTLVDMNPQMRIQDVAKTAASKLKNVLTFGRKKSTTTK